MTYFDSHLSPSQNVPHLLHGAKTPVAECSQFFQIFELELVLFGVRREHQFPSEKHPNIVPEQRLISNRLRHALNLR